MRSLLSISVLVMGLGAAHADNVPSQGPYAEYSDPINVVAAVQTNLDAKAGQHVRLAVYENKDDFLEIAAVKHQGEINETGLAIVRFRGLEPGEYAFAAYLDENGDGRLNRGVLGIPREPIAFSNGVNPKWRRPNFDETKVAVAPGSVIVITLED